MKKLVFALCIILVLSLLVPVVMPIFADEPDYTEVSYTDLFYGYPYYLFKPVTDASMELNGYYSATLDKCAGTTFAKAVVETSMESFGNLKEQLKLFSDALGITTFTQDDAAKEAALKVFKTYYSDEMKYVVNSEKALKDVSKYTKAAKKMGEFVGLLEEAIPENTTDENWFWGLYNQYSNLVYLNTGYNLNVPGDMKSSFYEYYKGQIDAIADEVERAAKIVSYVAELGETIGKYAIIGDIQVELIDYILENEYLESEMRTAFQKIKNDIKGGWVSYVLRYYVGKKLIDKCIKDAKKIMWDKLFSSDLQARFGLYTICVNLMQWVLFDLIQDSANAKDWMVYSYIGGFFNSLCRTFSNKLGTILSEPITSKEIEDLEYFYAIYASTAYALMKQSDSMGYEGTEDITNKYVFDYSDYIDTCLSKVSSIDVDKRVTRTIDESKSYNLSGVGYVCMSKPTEEHDYWIAPFHGEILYPLSFSGALNVACDVTAPQTSIVYIYNGSKGSLNIGEGVVLNVNGYLSNGNQLTLSNSATLNVRENVSNNGQLTLGNGATLNVSGNMSNSGQVHFGNATAYISGDYIGSQNSSAYLENGSVTVIGNITNGGTMNLGNGTANVGGDFYNYQAYISSFWGPWEHIGTVYCGTCRLTVGGKYAGAYLGGPFSYTCAKFYLEFGHVEIAGDANFDSSSNGTFNSENADGYILVNGNANVGGGATTLSAGTLEVKGNCTISERANFSGTHRVILSGTEKQTVSGYYNTLIVENSNAVISGNYNCLFDGKADAASVSATDASGAPCVGFVPAMPESFTVVFKRPAAQKWAPYSLSYTEPGESKEMHVSLAIPKGSKAESFTVYRVNGEFMTKMDAAYDGSGKVVFDTNRDGSYIVSEVELVKYGDTTGDGKVTLSDTLRLFRNLVDDNVSMDIAAADYSGDEDLSILDALMIMQSALNPTT